MTRVRLVAFAVLLSTTVSRPHRGQSHRRPRAEDRGRRGAEDAGQRAVAVQEV